MRAAITRFSSSNSSSIMRIAYISNSSVPSQTGNSVQVMRMCEAFAAHGHDVRLFYQTTGAPAEEATIHAYYGTEPTFRLVPVEIRKEPLGFVRYILRLRSMIRSGGYDLAYGRFLYGCALAAFYRIPVVYEAHMPLKPGRFVEKILLSYLIRSKMCRRFVAISEALAGVYRGYGVAPSRIVVAHDGADERGATVKAKLWGRANAVRIGFVGNLYEGKGLELIGRLAPLVPDADFHIVGGSETDIALWKERIQCPNILWYGHQPQAEVYGDIEAFDVCLLPIQRVVRPRGSSTLNIAEYTSPLKLFEYMSRKKAIVASDLPVLREVLDDTNAVLVPPEDERAWTAAIRMLIDDPPRRAVLGEAAHADLVEQYTWRRRAERVLKGIF